MLNKLRKIHTNYQFFVAFEEPFADTFLLERNKQMLANLHLKQRNRKFDIVI